MKNLFCLLLIFLIYNTSFCQEKTNNVNLLNDDLKASIFKFHPNPVDNQLFIIGTVKIKRIEIIDILGKNVATYFFNKSIIKIDVSQLRSGLYLIEIRNENDKLEIKKLIKK
ncbi:T9SS type A sorting domain-containing protein [Flavivirga spongiicola]|uniref:T9SS type A sorting domain-containing protein n=1 Tax=Flavivirga spongiicola TaxID=421621 RepID=A0ABU7XSF9_9FLAO|nr:T9SS type A sorting domain-containing protein [Flavivirga sp. MEBiC05379]MDO5978713.1 T9SS type A sorting domain-containing protein [Flavivirga sp. MEBiC05379]